MDSRLSGAITLLALAVAEYVWPGHNGIFFDAVETSPAETRLTAVVLATGALVLFNSRN